MKKKEMETIIRGYFRELEKNFRVIKKDITADTIKPFRIEIKKLRAFLRLLATRFKNPDELKLKAPLKDMHKSGGRYRDLQLHQQRIKTAMNKKAGVRFSSKLLDAAKTEIRKEKERFLSNYKFGKTEKKLIPHLPGHYATADVRKFFKEKLAAINAITEARTWTDKEMHAIRKKLKDILYILKLYVVLKKPLGFRFWNKTQLEKIKKIEDELGLLNDTRNALNLLGPDQIKQYEGVNKKLLDGLRRSLLNKRRRQKKQLIASLEKNIFRVTF